MAAGQVREDPAGLGESDVGALANGEVTEGLGDVCLADSDGSEQDDRLDGVEPAQGAEVTDLSAGSFEEAVKSNSSRVTCCSNFTIK